MIQHRPEIDGLRSIAVIPVILFHAGIQTFSGGFVGVDVFFVISGYLITSNILTEHQAGTFSLARFYERRARRILPALFFMMAVSIPFAWAWLLPSEWKLFSRSLITVPLFLSNVLFAKNSGYFDAAVETQPLLHTWSLGVEEQYYLLFPLLFLLSYRVSRKIILWLVILALISLGMAEWGIRNWPTANFYLLPGRTWELLIGALTAVYLIKHPLKTKPAHAQFSSMLGLVLIAIPILQYSEQTPFPSIYGLVPCIGTALVIMFSSKKTIVGRTLGSAPLVGVGLVSYSAYLWHHPLFAFARLRSTTPLGVTVMLGLSALALMLAYLSWKYVETPFRNRHWLTRRQIFAFGGIASLLFIVAGVVGQGENTLTRSRIDTSALDSMRPTNSVSLQQTDTCFLLTKDANALAINTCLFRLEGRPTVLLLGDSHAASLYPGLKQFLDHHNINLVMLTAAACLPIVTQFPDNTSRTATPRCAAINQRIEETLETQKFDLVIVSSFIQEWGFRRNSKWTYPGYYQDYKLALGKLHKYAPVLVIGQFPSWKEWLPDTLTQEISIRGGGTPNMLPQFSAYGLDSEIFSTDKKVKADMQHADIPYLSVLDATCHPPECMRYISTPAGNRLFTSDYGHLGLEASQFLSDTVVGPEILKLLQIKKVPLQNKSLD